MKERIVIDKVNNNDFEHICHFSQKEDMKYKIEQVPENWEELKTMCEEIKEDIIWNEDYCEIKNFKISKDGNIYYRQIQIYYDGTITKNYITVVNDRTVPQIWAFIKSLIGEEK